MRKTDILKIILRPRYWRPAAQLWYGEYLWLRRMIWLNGKRPNVAKAAWIATRFFRETAWFDEQGYLQMWLPPFSNDSKEDNEPER